MNETIPIDDNRQDIVIAWIAAILIHLLFFSLTGKMFVKPPQFAIAPSREIDINLIEESKSVKSPNGMVVERLSLSVEAKQSFNSKKIASSVSMKSKSLLAMTQAKRQTKQLGLLPPSAQVKVEAKPDYIQNPPPPYPPLAKQMRQEGIVMLSVDVNKEGAPINIEIIKSSGYRLLDQAALKAVRYWKFQPGSIGNIPVESMVTVPIRFRLEK